MAELLLSSRAGQPQLTGPQTPDGRHGLKPPTDWLGPVQSCGRRRYCPLLADLGYAGDDWHEHWHDYAADVLTPPDLGAAQRSVLVFKRAQAIETAFAALVDSFGLHFPRAHCTWGLLTRIGAKIAAYNVGILVNRRFDRPDLALATLVV